MAPRAKPPKRTGARRAVATAAHQAPPRQRLRRRSRDAAWLTAHRWLARDCEGDLAVSEAFIRWAAINTMVRRLAREEPATRQQRRILNPPE